MATDFPASIDTLTNPTANDKMNVVSHSDQHANANDAIEALETKVGADSSAVTTTHDYKVSGIPDGDKALSLTGTETVTNKTVDADENTISNIGDEEIKAGVDAEKIGNGSVSNAEFETLNGVTSSIQSQIDTKPDSDDVVLKDDTDVSGTSWVIDEDDFSSDVSTKVPTQQSVKAYVNSVASGILFPTVNVFSTSGTWTKPSGLQYVIVEVVGGGGGGAPSEDSSINNTGAGGGGGGYSKKVFLATALGATEAVTVGLGGSGETNTGTSNDDGTAGGVSSFGSVLSANGGGAASGTDPGVGATASTTGDVNSDGQTGREASTSGSSDDTGDGQGFGGRSLLGSVGRGGNGDTSFSDGTTGDNGEPGIVIVTEFSL